MRYFFYFLLASFIFTACDDRKAVKALQDQTLAIHDEAMKEMAEMNRKGRALKSELATLDTLPPNKARRDTIAGTLALMEKAEADMMIWMSQWKAPDDLPKAAALKYLEEQKRMMEANLAAMKAWKK